MSPDINSVVLCVLLPESPVGKLDPRDMRRWN